METFLGLAGLALFAFASLAGFGVLIYLTAKAGATEKNADRLCCRDCDAYVEGDWYIKGPAAAEPPSGPPAEAPPEPRPPETRFEERP
jgi:hypothetical protein